MQTQPDAHQDPMEALLPAAHEAAELLRQADATVAVAESSSGGLIAAALLAVPGASAYFRGGAVVYTGDAKAILLSEDRTRLTDPRAATPAHAVVLADAVRRQLTATWGIGETGAAGPTGNRYGDPAGHSCVAVVGPEGQQATQTVATGEIDRAANMTVFALAAIRLLAQALRAS